MLGRRLERHEPVLAVPIYRHPEATCRRLRTLSIQRDWRSESPIANGEEVSVRAADAALPRRDPRLRRRDLEVYLAPAVQRIHTNVDPNVRFPTFVDHRDIPYGWTVGAGVLLLRSPEHPIGSPIQERTKTDGDANCSNDYSHPTRQRSTNRSGQTAPRSGRRLTQDFCQSGTPSFSQPCRPELPSQHCTPRVLLYTAFS